MIWEKWIKQAMAGLSCAHVGELLPWEEKCRILEVDPHGEMKSMGTKSKKEVVLMVGQTMTHPLLDYVVYSCQCLEAGLTLLLPPSLPKNEAFLAPHLNRLSKSGIVPRLVRLESSSTTELIRYLHRHNEVIFVVVGTRDAAWKPLYEPVRGSPRWRLDIPVVVVNEENPLPEPA